MSDTLWSDISEFQTVVNDQYPYSFLAIRSNDGLHQDAHFNANRSWCDKAVASGKLWGYIVYYFYRPGVDGAQMQRAMVGVPNPRMVCMIDVESAGGAVSGDQSAVINQQFAAQSRWLGKASRVVGYGNVGDLNSLWPTKPEGARLIIADYGGNPPYPGKYAHQFSDSANTPPFGPSDLNSADGMSQADLEAMYGFTAGPTPPTNASGETVTFIQEINVAGKPVYWFIADGVNSYWRLVPAGQVQDIPASMIIPDPNGSWLAMWKTAPSS